MNVPKLRFYEFNDEWKKEKLNKHASFLQGLTYNPKDISEEGVIVLRSSNIQNSSISYNDIIKVNINIPEKLKIHENDILMCVRNGSKKLVGKTALLGKSEEKCTWGAFMNIIRPVENNKFIYYYLNSPYFYKHIWKDLGTATVNQITKQTLDSFKLNIPTVTEQKKIGNMLSLLDRKIELQSKKIEALKLYKLCISNIYFKEQDEKNYKISDFCYIITSSSKNNYIEFGGKKFIMDMGTVDSDGNIIYSKPTNYDKDIISKGDLIMPKDDIGGGLIIGKTAYIDAENKYILGDHVFCLKCKNINSLYLHYLINSIYVNKLLRKKVTGSAQLGINSTNVLNQEIFVHEKVEQNKIADTLLLIDNNILLNKKKLEKLIFFKKGLMQKMFV